MIAQLNCISDISDICQHTNIEDIAGQSANDDDDQFHDDVDEDEDEDEGEMRQNMARRECVQDRAKYLLSEIIKWTEICPRIHIQKYFR